MILAREELERILENGFSDIDEDDPYQVYVKVYLNFAKCSRCGNVTEIVHLNHVEDPEWYSRAAEFLKDEGWECSPRLEVNAFDLTIVCPECFLTAKEMH